MNEAGIRVANRAGPQAQDLAWSSRVEPMPHHRPRWPFKVMRKEQNATSKSNPSTAALNKTSFCFTT